MNKLALTIDMDSPGEYAALHGLTLPAHDPQLFYGRALDRFVELCDAVRARGTVFAIGRDVYGRAGARLAALAKAGFEIASHSYAHDYHLSLRAPEDVRRDLRMATEVLAEALGHAPRGFRAPGYHLSNAVLDALEKLGYAYDSSTFPSAPYYAAKAVVLGGYALLGKRSASLLGSPRLCSAPTQPYRASHTSPYARGSRALIEVPVSVATPLRLPITGASLVLAPRLVRKILTRALAEQPWVVLNLHGMDLADADELPGSLARHQPELRLPWSERRRRLLEVFKALAQGRRAEPLASLLA